MKFKKKKKEPKAKAKGPKKRRQFSIRYKFLFSLMGILLTALSVFFYFAYETFREDKTLFITELNLTVLKSVNNELEADFRRRIYEIQSLIPILHEKYSSGDVSGSTFELLSPDLRSEIMAITIYKKDKRPSHLKKDGYTYFLREDLKRLIKVREHVNYAMLTERKMPVYIPSEINAQHPIVEGHIDPDSPISWLNRSIRLQKGDDAWDVPVLSLVFRAQMVGGTNDSFIISVDLQQDFLRKKLQESDMAEMFLIQKDGRLISHSNLDTTIDYADRVYDHPLLERLEVRKNLPRETAEIQFDKQNYLASFGQTSFSNVFLVSQIRKDMAFSALTILVKRFSMLALFIVCIRDILFMVLY